jgi:gliding motility-associated-like protein
VLLETAEKTRNIWIYNFESKMNDIRKLHRKLSYCKNDSIDEVNTATGLSAGTYVVTVTDAFLCTATTSVVIAQPASALSALGSSVDATCGQNNGTASIVANGGTPGYTYSWTPNASSSNTASNLAAGVYTVVVKDLNNCTTTVNITVNAVTPPVIAPNFSSVCNGNNTFTFTDLSTNTPNIWNWNFGDPSSGAANTSTVQNPTHTYSAPGTYTVTLMAGTTCSGMFTFTKTVVILGVTSTSNAVSCNGGSDGTANVVVIPAGGTPTFQWNTTPAQTNSTATNLAAGNYTVIVSQPGSCPLTTVVFVTEPPVLDASVATTATNCGQSNGKAVVTVSGGTAPYTYNWSAGAGPGPNPINLAPGAYTVTVSDSKACSKVLQFNITSTGGVQIAGSTSQNVLCFGGATGSATITQPVGNGPFTFSWPAGTPNGNMATGLSAGTYIVTVSDVNQCTVTLPVVIDEPTELLVQSATTATSCGQDNGKLTLTANGGTPNYSYTWTPNVSTGTTASALAAGTYTVVVADKNNCSKTLNLTVAAVPPPMLSVLDIMDISCAGARDGGISLSVQDGTGPFTFTWSPSVSDTATAVGLTAGLYAITVQDAAKCIDTISVNLVAPLPVVTTAYSLGVKCPGETNGQIIVKNTTGGTGPYLYALGQGALGTASTFGNLASGSYLLETQDAHGCTDTDTLVVKTPLNNSVDAGLDTVITQGSSILLEAVVNDPGAIAHYMWQPGASVTCDTCPSTVAVPPNTLEYTVIVTDSNGCVIKDKRKITIRPGKIYVPNVINPETNIDNDRFTLYAESGVSSILLLQIFDRWGDLVFENKNFEPNNAQLGWDGRFRDKPVNPGVYTYLFKLRLIDGIEQVITGSITIVR